MLCGLSTESWTTKPPLLSNFAIPMKIRVHRLVYCCLRLCGSIFEDDSFRSCPFVMFFKYSFEKYRALCRSRNVKRNWSRFGCENQRLLWKSKKDLAGYSDNTNSKFAEFLLRRESSVSTPDGISERRGDWFSFRRVMPPKSSRTAAAKWKPGQSRVINHIVA